MIRPTEHICRVLENLGVRGVFFVDAGYLAKLKELSGGVPRLQADYQKVTEQLHQIHQRGHDVQLHVHPHWEDVRWDGKGWRMDTERYRIHSFSELEIADIVQRYKVILETIINRKVFAYRAGGWCLQPFCKIERALRASNIWLDSSVFCGGLAKSGSHYYDFRDAPADSSWRFTSDPTVIDSDGSFVEVPISSIRMSAPFFWRLAFSRLKRVSENQSFGDGISVRTGYRDKFKSLLFGATTPVSTDGEKSIFLMGALRKFQQRCMPEDYFVTIGHPKASTFKSLERMEEFVKTAQENHRFTSFHLEYEAGNIGPKPQVGS